MFNFPRISSSKFLMKLGLSALHERISPTTVFRGRSLGENAVVPIACQTRNFKVRTQVRPLDEFVELTAGGGHAAANAWWRDDWSVATANQGQDGQNDREDP